MQIISKRALRFELPDGRRVDAAPLVIANVPDWVTKTVMWQFAQAEEGLISILDESKQGRGHKAKSETGEQETGRK